MIMKLSFEEKIDFYKNVFKSKEHREFAIAELTEYEQNKEKNKNIEETNE